MVRSAPHGDGLHWALACVVVLCACHRAPPLRAFGGTSGELTSQAVLCDDATLNDDDFCLPGPGVETLLAHAPMQVLALSPTEAGTSGALKARVSFQTARGPWVLMVKLAVVPPGGGGYNREPRKELAAYRAQKLVLRPEEYVVPPTVMRCEAAETLVGRGPPQPVPPPAFDGLRCVLVTLSLWLRNVSDENVFTPQPGSAWRDAAAHLNLVTYLIGHRDSNPYNFLRSTDPRRPRLVSVDHSFSFSGLKNPIPTLKGQDWSRIRVPLPDAKIERLRQLSRADFDALRVVAQFRMNDGQAVLTEPGPPLDWDTGVREGDETLQWGLTGPEVAEMVARAQDLISAAQRGDLTTYR